MKRQKLTKIHNEIKPLSKIKVQTENISITSNSKYYQKLYINNIFGDSLMLLWTNDLMDKYRVFIASSVYTVFSNDSQRRKHVFTQNAFASLPLSAIILHHISTS